MTTGKSLLVKAFPATQLRQWNLPYQRYSGASGAPVREKLIAALGRRIHISEPQAAVMLRSPDALDAVIAAFAGVAVVLGSFVGHPEFDEEGWIAVHE